MHSTHLLLEEPIRMASILGPSKTNVFPAMTKIVGTLGPKSRSVEVISSGVKAGMSVARLDFSWGDADYHQETLENLRKAVKSTKKLCAEIRKQEKSAKEIGIHLQPTMALTWIILLIIYKCQSMI